MQPLLNGNLAKKIDDWEEEEKEEKEEEKKDDLLTCVASPQVKITYIREISPQWETAKFQHVVADGDAEQLIKSSER